MKDEPLITCLVTVGIAAVMLAAFCGAVWGATDAANATWIEARKQAILHHAAHYEADAQGRPVFRWNDEVGK